jgi:biopolymer transport protein ExbD
MIGLTDLFDRGGPVLYILFLVTLFIWFIIFSKYLSTNYNNKNWIQRDFMSFSKGIVINDANRHLFEESFLIYIKRVSSQRLKMLDGLIGMCPMLGLLGTVYGMIEVFEVLAVLGTGNPRAMSTGVAKATIPTMAGMTIALSGLFFKFDLANKVEKYQEQARIFLNQELRRYNKRRLAQEEAGLDLTPMMDIVFIMLIFFIVTTSFVKETGVDVNRPNAETAERDEKGNILVAITENDEIWIDKRRVDLKAVRANIERLKIEYPEGSVIIQADQRSRSGLLVEAMDQIRLAGVTNISIAAKNDN